MSLPRQLLGWLLRAYRLTLSPVLGALGAPLGLGCRFAPTCSQYALEAVERHGVIKGLGLTLRRLGRCHPWGGSGHDPVPRDVQGHSRAVGHPTSD
jgi:hypothetical protein